jgi:hypothetical protein
MLLGLRKGQAVWGLVCSPLRQRQTSQPEILGRRLATTMFSCALVPNYNCEYLLVIAAFRFLPHTHSCQFYILERSSHNYVIYSPLLVLRNMRQAGSTSVCGNPTTLSTWVLAYSKWPQTGISTSATTAIEARRNRQRC